MSKIFEALNRGQSDIAGIALSSVADMPPAETADAESEPEAGDTLTLEPPEAPAPEELVPTALEPEEPEPEPDAFAPEQLSSDALLREAFGTRKLAPEIAVPAPPVEPVIEAPVAPPAAPPVDATPPPAPILFPPAHAAPAEFQSPVRIVSLRITAPAPLLPFDGTENQASEQYRIIRTKLIHHLKQPRMIVVSSVSSGDGKTVTTLNLAGALSLKLQHKVLALDADFRNSTIHQKLGIPKSPGLAEVLHGFCTLEEALIRTEQMENLYVLPAGEPRSNPAELLDSPNWPALCARLRQIFGYIIVDSPPIAAVADYALIQAACDGIVLVMRPDHTPRKKYTAAMEMIPKEKLVGAVMNCVPDWFLRRYLSPHYDGYYRNGKSGD